jgi:PAS domain S-box-containing protein
MNKAANHNIKNTVTIDHSWMFDESPAPMYIFDVDTLEFLAVNEAALIQYRYTRKEFLSLNATQIRPEEEVELLKRGISDIHFAYSDFGRWKHLRKNGEIFITHVYAHSVNFNGRNALFIMAIDIDKKVKAEEQLLEKSNEIEDILESITDGFLAVNHQWQVTYINKAAEKFLNCKREDLLGANLWSFFPDSKDGKFYREYHRALEEKISVHFEGYYAPLDLWGDIHVYPKKDGLSVYFVDITQQKNIQKKIFNDEQNLRAIINNTKDIIWSIDRENNIISANEAFFTRMHYITKKKITRIDKEDFGEKLFNTWKEHFKRAFAGEYYKVIWTEEIDGKEVFEEVSFNPIFDKNNDTIGVSCISRDITAQYTHIRMIEKQNEQLKKISYIQSHEVRSPLSSILGLVQLFNKENCIDENNKEIITLLTQAAEKLDNVVKKITNQAKHQ